MDQDLGMFTPSFIKEACDLLTGQFQELRTIISPSAYLRKIEVYGTPFVTNITILSRHHKDSYHIVN